MATLNHKIDPGFWIGLLIVFGLCFCIDKCKAQQIDTIQCHVEYIQKFVQKKTPKSVRIYAVYIDKQQEIADVIPVSKTVYDYISTCKEYGIKPSLGIRIKDGNITSIVKRKRKYKL